MPRLCAVLFLAVALLPAPAALAQQGAQAVASPILTVDQERLFTGSAYGRALLDEINRESTALAAENREIEAKLVEEERDLTEKRAEMAPDAFRDLAEAFDSKVVTIRREQDEKARALSQKRDAAQQRFYREIAPILTEIVRERRAVAVLETRAVVLSADQIDITDAAIARIDTRLAPEAEKEAPAAE
ncbi:Skp family chaperone for outer membrane proteins [Rhodovulum iodosum]|uniref:Skp family chaperone for outer membrane proteins n=1 Tax=Rhodovulum iodosum TaxID=68291 RepID=A0ABV3XUA2_9RHOB|nr:OmpH family outer membrane protein [Rhodovulum robiginosum]RSK38498.1 OmpH family outer membrane protein [Rhodovulum robiginosum]